MFIFTKPNYKKGISEIKQNNFSIWLKLDKNYFKSNLHGTLLTSICKSCQLRIVNGRFLGDSLGYFTFFNTNGKSTIDYMLVSQDLMYSINSFVVNPPSYLSDHCLIYMNLPGYATNSVGEFF